MRAVFCGENRRFEFRDLPRPQVGRGQVLVRVRSCGICGSDLDWFKGPFPPPEVSPGHEITGEVVEFDGQVSGLDIGERVAVEPLVVCGRCPACRAGDYQICPSVEVLGVTHHGGLAEYVVVPRGRIYALPPELDYAAGGLAEPAAVCVHGVKLGNVGMGDRVLVLGAGSIGLFCAMAARAAGAGEVAITARYPQQAEMARRIGAAHVFAADADGDRKRAEYTGDCPPDVVLETVGGDGQILDEAINVVRPGGTVVILGIFVSPPKLNALSVVLKEVRLVGSITYGHRDRRADFELALGMLASNASMAHDLVTHRFEIEAIHKAFETASDKKRGTIKVAVMQ
jgi:2-desacetyl-2-hydroxyethyl bacteriochlorophyllide A dehydrogenase